MQPLSLCTVTAIFTCI